MAIKKSGLGRGLDGLFPSYMKKDTEEEDDTENLIIPDKTIEGFHPYDFSKKESIEKIKSDALKMTYDELKEQKDNLKKEIKNLKILKENLESDCLKFAKLRDKLKKRM